MIAIVNVSPPDAPIEGPNDYEVRINRTVITTFTHDRKVDGLAQCLRDAADAVDLHWQADREWLTKSLMRSNML